MVTQEVLGLAADCFLVEVFISLLFFLSSLGGEAAIVIEEVTKTNKENLWHPG